MNHRREIDGLRAIAVLPVILYHAGISLFSGGFVGVDIFFVISGYLITGIIITQLAAGHFSLRHFYARRARRILPALFCVMFASIPFAIAWMLPSQYHEFSHSLIAVTVFASNLLFWRESGYFAAEASEKPLLHTWSLGVEEQYYLLIPLALMLLWRFGRRRAFYAVLLGTVISFALCEYASRFTANANFFLLPTRAWELLAGSLCAFGTVTTHTRKYGWLALLGLAMIAVAVFAYDTHMRLPSVYTLMPVLGTVLILRYGMGGTWTARVLSLQPLVGIGLISYSAYLWHFPLFAFTRLRSATTPEPLTMLGLAALALVLGAITWRWVEQPFRRQGHPRYVGNRRALAMGGIAAVMLVAIGVYGHTSDGMLRHWTANALPNQIRANALLEDASKENPFYDNGECIFNIITIDAQAKDRLVACRARYGAGIAIIGDSHAINTFHRLRTNAQAHAFIIGISQGMCRPQVKLTACFYDALVELLKREPGLFSEIFYKQAGFHLLRKVNGAPVERADFSGLPLDATVPDFMPSTAHIDGVIAYLETLSPFARVTWLGPRIEPHIRRTVVVRLGCDYPFRLRPNQLTVFERLDDTIRAHLANTSIHYHSYIRTSEFDMAKDFMNCEVTYFKDGDHYSAAGEVYFGKRMTLDALLREGGRHE